VDPEPLLATASLASGNESAALSALLLVVALLACFLFAGTETAITSMGELRVKKLLEDRHGPDGLLHLWLHRPSEVLTTLLTGNTLASVAASSIATSLTLSLCQRYGLDADWTDWAVAGAVAGLGAIILVAGEIAPKTLAKHHPDWFIQPMHAVWWFHRATRWFSAGMIWAAMHIVRGLGGNAHHRGVEVTEAQIEDMVRLGNESGSIPEDEGDILQSVFKLSDTMLTTIMTPRTKMAALSLDATREEVLAEVRSSRWSRYPVYAKTPDEIVGFFYAKDLFDPKIGFDPFTSKPRLFRLADHLHEPMRLPGTMMAMDALKEFQRKKMHLAVVMDEHGGTEGIVSLEDVLEELVGDIYDEYDEPKPEIVQTAASLWTLDGGTELRELADSFDIELPQTESTTVGGFVVEHLGHLPEIGDSLQWQELTFRVLDADDTRVKRLELQCNPAKAKTPPPSAAAQKRQTGAHAVAPASASTLAN